MKMIHSNIDGGLSRALVWLRKPVPVSRYIKIFSQRPFIVAHYFSGVIVLVKNNADLLRRPNASLLITGALKKITELNFTNITFSH